MYFCTNCGQSNSDEITVCPNCGSIKPSYLSIQPCSPMNTYNASIPVSEGNISQSSEQPAFAPQPMQQPMYGYAEPYTKPQTNIAKLIFEFASLLCSILVIVQLFMPLISIERGNKYADISVYEAIINSIDSFKYIDFDETSESVVFALLASTSSLLGFYAIISAVIVFISKIIALVNTNKSDKINLTGLYSLFSLQLAYLLFGNLLLFTDPDNVNDFLRLGLINTEFEIMIGWILPTVIIAITIIYGVIIGFIYNKNDNENIYSIKNIANSLFGLFAAVIATIAAFLSVSVWYEIGNNIEKVELNTSGIILLIYGEIYLVVESFVEYEDILPFVCMIIGSFLLIILTFLMFSSILKNSLISIANKKFRSISCCVISTIATISVFVNIVLFKSMNDYEVKIITRSNVTILAILAIILLILSITHIVLNFTVFADRFVPMQNTNQYMQYGNMPMNNMNNLSNVNGFNNTSK